MIFPTFLGTVQLRVRGWARRSVCVWLALWLGLEVVQPAAGGIYYSGEAIRPFAAEWRGFLTDHRLLRQVAFPNPNLPIHPLRQRYQESRLKLESLQQTRVLTADELADLGALCLRLGDPGAAVKILRPAARAHPEHFRILTHLATAWQQSNALDQAASTLEAALEYAPAEARPAETLQLKLIQRRKAEGPRWRGVDELFPVRFPAVLGQPLLGAAPPAEAIALVQQLAWWFPQDGRLLWLLAELAATDGELRMAANLLEGCIAEYALDSPEARRRRQQAKDLVAILDQEQKLTQRTGRFAYRSPRVFQRWLDPASLPRHRPGTVHPIPWALLSESELSPTGLVQLVPYLADLEGEWIRLAGYIAPIGLSNKGEELTEFLLTEYPVGCWFCELPGPLQSLQIELAPGQSVQPTRELVRVVGRLRINRTDPEHYPFRLEEARIAPAD